MPWSTEKPCTVGEKNDSKAVGVRKRGCEFNQGA